MIPDPKQTITIVISGPVGSGKSTIAASIQKFLKKNKGDARWKTPDLTKEEVKERSQAKCLKKVLKNSEPRIDIIVLSDSKSKRRK